MINTSKRILIIMLLAFSIISISMICLKNYNIQNLILKTATQYIQKNYDINIEINRNHNFIENIIINKNDNFKIFIDKPTFSVQNIFTGINIHLNSLKIHFSSIDNSAQSKDTKLSFTTNYTLKTIAILDKLVNLFTVESFQLSCKKYNFKLKNLTYNKFSHEKHTFSCFTNNSEKIHGNFYMENNNFYCNIKCIDMLFDLQWAFLKNELSIDSSINNMKIYARCKVDVDNSNILIYQARCDYDGGQFFLQSPALVTKLYQFNTPHIKATLIGKFTNLRPLLKTCLQDFNAKGSIEMNIDGNLFNGALNCEIAQYKSINSEKIFVKYDNNSVNCKIHNVNLGQYKNIAHNLTLNIKNNKFSILANIANAPITIDGTTKLINDDINITLNNLVYDFPKHKITAHNSKISYINNNISAILDHIVCNDGFGYVSYSNDSTNAALSIKLTNFPFLYSIFTDKKKYEKFNMIANLSCKDDIFVGKITSSIKDISQKKSQIECNYDLTKDGINGKLLLYGGEKQYITLSGNIPLVFSKSFEIKTLSNKKIQCKFCADCELIKFLPLPDGIIVKGILKSDINISGTISKPLFFGQINLYNLLIQSDCMVLQNGEAKIKLNNSKAEIEQAIFIDRKKHSLKITGKADIIFKKNIPIIDLNLVGIFNKFLLFDSDELKIEILGNVNMTGPIYKPLLSGILNIPYAKFDTSIKNSDIEPSKIDVIYVAKNGINKKINNIQKNTETPQDSILNYDLILNCKDVRIVGTTLNSNFYGQLHLLSNSELPALEGNLKLKKGWIQVFSNKIPMRKGEIVFTKNNFFLPAVNLFCSRQFGDMFLYINMQYKPSGAFDFQISSSPVYQLDSIISKMLFKKTSSELHPIEAAQLAHAVAALNQKNYIFSFLEKIKALTLFDTFSVRQNGHNIDEQSISTTISASKYINEKLSLGIEKDSDANASANVQIEISPNISVRGNTKGEFGINWRKRF